MASALAHAALAHAALARAALARAALVRLAEGLVITRMAQTGRHKALRGHGIAVEDRDTKCAMVQAIRGRSRGPTPVARARQRAMYLAHVSCGLSLTSVGVGFGRDRTTVRHACALWEDARDDAATDLALSCEEASLQAMARHLAVWPHIDTPNLQP